MVDPGAAATGELVYQILGILDWEVTPADGAMPPHRPDHRHRPFPIRQHHLADTRDRRGPGRRRRRAERHRAPRLRGGAFRVPEGCGARHGARRARPRSPRRVDSRHRGRPGDERHRLGRHREPHRPPPSGGGSRHCRAGEGPRGREGQGQPALTWRHRRRWHSPRRWAGAGIVSPPGSPPKATPRRCASRSSKRSRSTGDPRIPRGRQAVRDHLESGGGRW